MLFFNSFPVRVFQILIFYICPQGTSLSKLYDIFDIKCGLITAKAALKFGSEAWVLKKREEQRLEAAQMKS